MSMYGATDQRLTKVIVRAMRHIKFVIYPQVPMSFTQIQHVMQVHLEADT